jgi:hypothetical protein
LLRDGAGTDDSVVVVPETLMAVFWLPQPAAYGQKQPLELEYFSTYCRTSLELMSRSEGRFNPWN